VAYGTSESPALKDRYTRTMLGIKNGILIAVEVKN